MAKAVVLLFLLETIPVLEVVSQKFGSTSDSVEGLFNDELSPEWYNPSHVSEEDYPATLNKAESLLDSPEQVYEKALERSNITINHPVTENVVNYDTTEMDYIKTNGTIDGSNVTLPESAPFLAAIFETVSSVTAQTCAGVLLSKRWVLTAASCVNVLRPIYGNSSSQIHNYYTIVIGASNPLIDGTVHNVSKIILYPTPEMDDSSNRTLFDIGSNSNKSVSAMLALMRIEPSLEGRELEIVDEEGWEGNTTMYGWTLMEGGPDMMVETSLPVDPLPPAQCSGSYGITGPSLMCFIAKGTVGNVTRMNSGGPVVARARGRRRLLALALADGTAPLAAYRLAGHADWLRKTTHM